MKVSIVDAGHFDAQTACARSTRCGSTTCARTSTGRTSRNLDAITNGIPDGAPVDAVARIQTQSLLFAGTERASMCRSMTASTGSRCG